MFALNRTNINKYEFIHQVVQLTEKNHTPADFLPKFIDLIQKNLPLKKVVVFYRSSAGNKYLPFSLEKNVDENFLLSEDTSLIGSFVNKKSSIVLEKDEEIYLNVFNKECNNLFELLNINYIFPIHCKKYYRGLLLAFANPKDSKVNQEIEELLNTAVNIFIPLIEAERLEMENDRNYYRLFKFDRLVLLGEMVASIAHELRTPMNTILFEIQEMSDNMYSPDEMTNAYVKIKNEVKRVNHFINSLLSFSRFKEISFAEIQLDQFLMETLTEIPSKRKPKNLTLNHKMEPAISLSTDPNRLRQVFFNVLFNAFDAVGEGGIIDINLYSEYKETQKDIKYIIAIKDNGPGIPQEMKEKVLEPFFTTKKDGTGLGLYISYGIMKSLKGDLEIESNENGTTVFLILNGD